MPGRFKSLAGRIVLATLALAIAPAASALSFLPWEHVRTTYDTFTHTDGISRTVAVMLPEQRSASPTPAIVVLHFNLGSAPGMANLTEIGELARDFGIAILLPVAHDTTWSHAPNERNPTDDAGFLAGMIDEYVQRYNLDAKRIYMTGYSQGGNMTVRMACEYPGKIAAGAVVAATMRKALARECQTPALPTPMVFFNGTNDQQVPYGPGVPSLIRDLLGAGALGAQDAAKFWADINGCSSPATRSMQPAPVNDGTSIQLDRYTCPANQGVAHYTIIEGGHTWPGVLDFVPVAGITTQNLRANRAMWDFFKEFSR